MLSRKILKRVLGIQEEWRLVLVRKAVKNVLCTGVAGNWRRKAIKSVLCAGVSRDWLRKAIKSVLCAGVSEIGVGRPLRVCVVCRSF